MFNFLVTGKSNAWGLPAYEYDRGRFGEYSSPAVMQKFKNLDATAIEELKSFPALFAYEGETHSVRVGYLRRIKERVSSILIEYEFEEGIPEIPFSKISDLKIRLDIQKWEMGRTHWAVKEEDLFEILFSVGLIDESFSNSTGQRGRVEEMRFKVALSFPGEKRDYISEVAAELKRRLPRGAVFYDRDFTSQLARPNLDTLLQKIYLNNSDLVVVFLSSDYEKKQWCGLEWRAIREIIKNKSDHSIMFMRFDNASVQGSFSIDGYVDLNDYDPVQAARLIVERVRSGDAPR